MYTSPARFNENIQLQCTIYLTVKTQSININNVININQEVIWPSTTRSISDLISDKKKFTHLFFLCWQLNRPINCLKRSFLPVLMEILHTTYLWHSNSSNLCLIKHDMPGMSIDFEVARENWKVAGKLMRKAQPSATPSLLCALYEALG